MNIRQPQQGSRILNAFVAQRQAQRRGVTVKAVRGYDAARNDNITFGWVGSSASANEDIKAALDLVRKRSRDLAQNNDYMRKFLRMVEVNVVGPHGFRYKNLAADPAARIGGQAAPDEAARTLIEEHWAKWAAAGMCEVTGRHSLRDVLKLAVKACARDGEYLLRRVRGRAAGNPYGYALQVLDVDRLDTKHNGEYGNNRIIMGVEVDDVMRPVAYHLLTTHPGDGTYLSRAGQRYERVLARDVFHGGVGDRPEQVRYMPWAHTAMLRLEMLGKFQTAAVVAARKGAETIGVLQQQPDADAPPPGSAALGQQGEDGVNYETSLPGQFDTLPAGYELKPFDTKYPSDVFGVFVKDCLRGVASGLMVAYNGLANDLEGVNYSSIRAGVIEERDGWIDLQEWLIAQLVDRMHADWLEMALLKGAITYNNGSALPAAKLDKFSAHKFTGRRWQWVDPRNDAQAAILAVQRGWTTDSQIAAERGSDWWDNIIEQAAEKDHAKNNNVTIGQTMPAPAPEPAASGQ